MLLFINMKAWIQHIHSKLTRTGGVPLFPLIAFFFSSLFMFFVLGAGLFSDALPAGPEIVLSGPSVDADAVGITTFTPTQLDSGGLRIGWSVATASVMGGISLIAWVAFRFAWKEDVSPIFSREASGLGKTLVIMGLNFILLGGIGRAVLNGRVADSVGVSAANLESSDTDLQLWVFDVDPLAFGFLVLAFGWVWERGAKLYVEAENVI